MHVVIPAKAGIQCCEQVSGLDLGERYPYSSGDERFELPELSQTVWMYVIRS